MAMKKIKTETTVKIGDVKSPFVISKEFIKRHNLKKDDKIDVVIFWDRE